MDPYNTQMGYSLPLSGITTETLLPAYNLFNVDSVLVKSESGLMYNLLLQRKRSRDSLTPLFSYRSITPEPKQNSSSFSFSRDDVSRQIQQHQVDVDRLIAHHMKEVRTEVEEMSKRQARKVLEAIEFVVTKKLKSKDAEIENMVKLNWALEEKVKTLCIENRIWRNLAQTNEATANALRTNLEQVLAQQVDRRNGIYGMGFENVMPVAAAALMNDTQSCCGSNDGGEVMGEVRMLADVAHGKGVGEVRTSKNEISSSSRLCRSCGEGEACVLILPCRHLCLCTVCGSTLHTCPICKSFMNASLHVNNS